MNDFRKLVETIEKLNESSGVRNAKEIAMAEIEKLSAEIAGVREYGNVGDDHNLHNTKMIKHIAQEVKKLKLKLRDNLDGDPRHHRKFD
jgi:hypothetical protein